MEGLPCTASLHRIMVILHVRKNNSNNRTLVSSISSVCSTLSAKCFLQSYIFKTIHGLLIAKIRSVIVHERSLISLSSG